MKIKPANSVIKRVGRCFALTMGLLCAGKLHAADLVFQFDTTFPSNPNPSGPAPWIEVYFQDVRPGTVQLTISNVNLAAGEFIGGKGNGASGGLFFNLNPKLKAANLIFTRTGSSGSFTAPTIQTGTDRFKADGDGLYDIRFDFATSRSGRFNGNDSVTYTMTGISTLTAADFVFLSKPAGGNGPFYAAAHIQGLSGYSDSTYSDSCYSDSTWIEPSHVTTIPVPEPTTAALAVMGGLFLTGWMLTRRHSAR